MTVAPITPAMGAYLALLALQRGAELALSKHHARRLVSRGAREFGRRHFVMFVALHALYPLLLLAEVSLLGARPPAAWPAWLMIWLAAQGLRVWAIASLGTFWNVRVWVVPGAAPVARGAYRFMRHPNYVAVIAEFIAAPLMFGAWRTALACSVLNAVALLIRIPAEERALRWAAAAAAHTGPPDPEELSRL